MNANKLAKAKQIEEISSKLTSAKALVVTGYTSLTVQELQTLKKEFKTKGVEAKVYKNRLFKIAAKQSGIEGLDSSLIGQNLYVFGMEDDISPAKIIAKFAKEFNKPDALEMKIGTFEGKVVDSAALTQIAALPSMEEALTILAMSLLSPIKQIGVGLKMLVDEGKLEPIQETKTT